MFQVLWKYPAIPSNKVPLLTAQTAESTMMDYSSPSKQTTGSARKDVDCLLIIPLRLAPVARLSSNLMAVLLRRWHTSRSLNNCRN